MRSERTSCVKNKYQQQTGQQVIRRRKIKKVTTICGINMQFNIKFNKPTESNQSTKCGHTQYC